MITYQNFERFEMNDPHEVRERVSEKRKQNKVKDTSILPIVNN